MKLDVISSALVLLPEDAPKICKVGFSCHLGQRVQLSKRQSGRNPVLVQLGLRGLVHSILLQVVAATTAAASILSGNASAV